MFLEHNPTSVLLAHPRFGDECLPSEVQDVDFESCKSLAK